MSEEFTLAKVDAPGEGADWAKTFQNMLTMGAAGLIFKHSGLNTLNQNNTVAGIDPATGLPYAAGVPLPSLGTVGRSVGDVVRMNTTTMAVVGLACIVGLWVLLKK
ncbi:hypothetical protein [Chitinivorax sp. B]|uniref:hypothetical protein n=1 Tax=Chitinivorax sp. B TaxID=2502235 RepID=UPI0010FA1FAE|nr:hypothetical protein [Chitinivorax sp. B]